MKSIHYAIASIVDANTGFDLHRDAGDGSYAAAERNARQIRAKTVVDILGFVRRKFGSAIYTLRNRVEQRRRIREIIALSDRQLDDIGLNRGDVLAVQQGIIDLAQLEDRRLENLGDKRIRLYRDARQHRDVSRHAVNEAIFARAKCA